MGCIKTLETGSADEFISKLRLSHEHWRRNDEKLLGFDRWAFRGQSDANWPLLPSVFRDQPGDPKAQSIPRPNRSQALIQTIRQEYGLVFEFIRLADEIGLEVPLGPDELAFAEDRVEWDEGLSCDDTSVAIIGENARFAEMAKCFALAQHHGIQTRLLDFTKSPLVAAWFAACDAYELLDNEPPNPNARMAVWAIDMDALRSDPHNATGHGYRVAPLSVPRSTNVFLHAQHGLFLYVTDSYRIFDRQGSWPTLDGILNGCFRVCNRPIIYKVIVPTTEVSNILRLLYNEKITPAHLMPTYDQVTFAMRHSTLLHDLIRPGCPTRNRPHNMRPAEAFRPAANRPG